MTAVQPCHAPEQVRAALDRLVREGVDWGRESPAPRADVREAAVLVLFGRAGGTAAGTAGGRAEGLDLLFVERAASLSHHPGQIAFPGGRLDPEDSGPVAAALREAEEETGLDPTGVDVVGTLGALSLPVSNHQVTPVVGWWARPSAVSAVDPGESASVFRVPVAELVDPANRRVAVMHRDERSFDSPAFVAGPRIIWGFTGIVVDRVLDALGWAQPWEPLPVDVPV